MNTNHGSLSHLLMQQNTLNTKLAKIKGKIESIGYLATCREQETSRNNSAELQKLNNLVANTKIFYHNKKDRDKREDGYY